MKKGRGKKGKGEREERFELASLQKKVGSGWGEEIEARGPGGRDRVNNNRRESWGVSSDPV